MLSSKSLIAALACIDTAAATYTPAQIARANNDEIKKSYMLQNSNNYEMLKRQAAIHEALLKLADLDRETSFKIYRFETSENDLIGLNALDLEVAREYFDSKIALRDFVISEMDDSVSKRILEADVAADRARISAGIQQAEAALKGAAAKAIADAKAAAKAEAAAAKAAETLRFEKASEDARLNMRAVSAEVENLPVEKRNKIFDFWNEKGKDLIGLDASDLKLAQKYFDSMFTFSASLVFDKNPIKLGDAALAAKRARADAGIQEAEAALNATEAAADAQKLADAAVKAAAAMAEEVNGLNQEALKALAPETREANVEQLNNYIQELKEKLKHAKPADKAAILANINSAEAALSKLQGSSVILWVIVAVVVVSAVGAGIFFYMRK